MIWLNQTVMIKCEQWFLMLKSQSHLTKSTYWLLRYEYLPTHFLKINYLSDPGYCGPGAASEYKISLKCA